MATTSDQRRNWQPEDLRKLRLPEDAQISAPGTRVAFVEHTMAPYADEYYEGIKVAYLGRDSKVIDTVDVDGGNSPRFSPDGRRLAYLAEATVPARQRVGGYDKTYQLFVADADRLDPSLYRSPKLNTAQLTKLPFDVVGHSWSPDGRSLAITYAEMTPDDPEVERAWNKRGIDIPRIRHIRTPDYKLDTFSRTADDSTYYGYTYEYAWNMAVVDAQTGEFRALTSGPGSKSSPAWSPDGRQIAFLSDVGTPESRRRSDLWVMSSDGTQSHRLLADDSISITSTPVWSPDGAHIAFLASPYPIWYGHEDLYVVRADGTGLRNMTAGQRFTVGDQGIDDVRDEGEEMLWWSKDGSALIFAASQDGSVQIKRADLVADRTRAKRITDLTTGEHRITSASMSRSGKLALSAATWDRPGDIVVQAPGREPRRITSLNDELLAKRITRTPESLAVTATDGLPVQAWILRPDGDHSVKRPAIVEVHGGPAAMYGASFFLEWQIMAGAGYNVVFGNPRGSTGYGRDWSSRVFGDMGGGDFRDVMAITDAAVASGGVDAKKLGIEGGSYGGFMTNWAIGKTNRFAAALAGRSISNWMSFYGTSDGGTYAADEIGGTPWEKTSEYLRRSPISSVAKVRTPLLLMHSDHDLRVPLEQAEQMFQALKTLGQDVELDISENASHELSRAGSLRQRVARLHRIRDWFDSRLQPGLTGPSAGERGLAA
jgi:dipeptidyl aminopeptidase/acylaminoacyl peptidase